MNPNVSVVAVDVYAEHAQAAFQYGMIARVTREIINTTSKEKLTVHCKRFFSNLNLPAYLKFHVAKETTRCEFGDGLNKAVALKLQQFLANGSLTGKVIRDSDLLVIRTKNIFVLIDTSNHDARMVDILQDSLVIFVDTLQSWTDNVNQQALLREQYQATKAVLMEKIRASIFGITLANKQLIQNYYNTTEALLSSLVTSFSTLGLEVDQEEAVLDLVDKASKNQFAALKDQMDTNSRLVDILKETIETLDAEVEGDPEAKSASDDEFDSGEAVQLF